MLWVLRDIVGLTGTKFGCGMALCGACTIHLDGQPIRSCVTPVAAVIGKSVSAALFSEITLKDGRVEQGNFHNYRTLRINEAPRVDVHLVKSTETPGGIGEPGTSAVAPAVVNAIFAATGKRLRKLPVDPAQLRAT